ncbi:MAG TPA: potassium/proton antiporter [Solirubrobacterales bacterium]|nr:potassium/proton antiporter [Solirubrobacterales bacterium]
MGGHDAELILVAGALLAAGIVGALLADRVRIPGLLLFLALGMLAGSEGIGGIEFDNTELARTLGTIALVLILFEGGLTAGWSEIRPVLGTAASLATVGTVVTAALAGIAAKWIFGLSTLEGLIVGAAIAATDSAAIFAVLRRSTLEKRLARSLEGESGMNDPVALLLVIGFIDWIQQPGYGILDMAGLLALKLALGAAIGLTLGRLAVAALDRVQLPTDGIYPVATIAIAGLAYGLAEVAHGSGLLATYLTALALGSSRIPARRTVVAFHEGVGWVAQIGLFILLGLLVFPSKLGDVALEGLALSAVLILVARPLAAFVATIFAPLNLRERAMLGWAGLRGATPIWLATFPVVAGVGAGQELFSIVFFVVVTSTLIQGASFEPLAKRLGLTTDEPALPRRLLESGRIRRMGGDVVSYRLRPGAAAAGHLVRELGLPREALVNVIVRDGRAIPPRGSTEVREGDELHVLVRGELREEVEELTRQWHEGPVGIPPPPQLPPRGAPQIFTVRAGGEIEDPSAPREIDGIAVVAILRSRRDRGSALAALADGRYAITTESLVALGSRQALARWCERRAARCGDDPAERAWWQEAIGALIARG